MLDEMQKQWSESLIDLFITHDNHLPPRALLLERVDWRDDEWLQSGWTRQQGSEFALVDFCKKARDQPRLHSMWA